MPTPIDPDELLMAYGHNFQAEVPKPAGMGARALSSVQQLGAAGIGIGEALGLPLGDARRRMQIKAEDKLLHYYDDNADEPQRWADARGLADKAKFGLGQAVDMAPGFALMYGASLVGGPPASVAAATTMALGRQLQYQRQAAGRTDILATLPVAVASGGLHSVLGVGGAITSRTLGTGIGALDAAGMPWLNSLSGVTGGLARMGAAGAKGALAQSVESGIDAQLDNVARLIVDKSTSFTSPEAIERTKQLMIAGAFTGGLFGAGMKGWKRRPIPGEQFSARPIMDQPEDMQPAQGQQPVPPRPAGPAAATGDEFVPSRLRGTANATPDLDAQLQSLQTQTAQALRVKPVEGMDKAWEVLGKRVYGEEPMTRLLTETGGAMQRLSDVDRAIISGLVETNAVSLDKTQGVPTAKMIANVFSRKINALQLGDVDTVEHAGAILNDQIQALVLAGKNEADPQISQMGQLYEALMRRAPPSLMRAPDTVPPAVPNLARVPAPAAPAPVQPEAPDTPTDAAAAPAPLTGPNMQRVFTATGDLIDTQMRVVEADDLKFASGTLQPRDRTRSTSDQQIDNIAKKLVPQRLGPSAESDRGAPIVGPDMTIESGNARVRAIKMAQTAYPDRFQSYRSYIEELGFDTAGMNTPVLVRQRITSMDTAQRVKFAQDSNFPSTMDLTAVEKAKIDSSVFTDDVLTAWRGGDIDSAGNRDFERAFIGRLPVEQKNAMLDADGNVSPDGIVRIRRALLAAAYDDTKLLSALMESADDNIRSIGAALYDTAAPWLQMRRMAADNTIDPALDITGQLVTAARTVSQLRRQRLSVGDWMQQTDFETPHDPVVDAMVRAFYNDNLTRPVGRDQVGTVLKKYVDYAKQQETPELLGGKPPTPLELARGAVEQRNETIESASNAPLFATAGPPAPEQLQPDGAPDVGPSLSRSGTRAPEPAVSSAGQSPARPGAATEPVGLEPPELSAADQIFRARFPDTEAGQRQAAIARAYLTAMTLAPHGSKAAIADAIAHQFGITATTVREYGNTNKLVAAAVGRLGMTEADARAALDVRNTTKAAPGAPAAPVVGLKRDDGVTEYPYIPPAKSAFAPDDISKADALKAAGITTDQDTGTTGFGGTDDSTYWKTGDTKADAMSDAYHSAIDKQTALSNLLAKYQAQGQAELATATQAALDQATAKTQRVQAAYEALVKKQTAASSASPYTDVATHEAAAAAWDRVARTNNALPRFESLSPSDQETFFEFGPSNWTRADVVKFAQDIDAQFVGAKRMGGNRAEQNTTAYRGQHTAPDPNSGTPLSNLKGTYPDDFYGPNGFRYYAEGDGEGAAGVYSKVIALKGRDRAPVTVYRAVPLDSDAKIEPGDWVTPSRAYAREHGLANLNGKFKIISKTARAGELFTDGNSILEWGYYPKGFDSADANTNTNTNTLRQGTPNALVDAQLRNYLARGPDEVQAGPAGKAAQSAGADAVQELQATANPLARSMAKQYAANQRISLVGQQVGSAEDLAMLAQIYRDPRFETTRTIFVDDAGDVVAQVGLTSRLPASAKAVVGTSTKKYLADISEKASAEGASGYYMLHNHPSGAVTPSNADMHLTSQYIDKLPGMKFLGHIIIDTDVFSLTTEDGKSKTLPLRSFAQPTDFALRMALTESLTREVPSGVKPSLKQIATSQDFKDISRSFKHNRDDITLISVDPQWRVRGVSTIPESVVLTNSRTTHRQLQRAALSSQGAALFAVGNNRDTLQLLGSDVVDAIFITGAGKPISMQEEGLLPGRGNSLFPADRRARVSPDTSPSFKYLRDLSLQPDNLPGHKPMQRVGEDTPEYSAAGAMPQRPPQGEVLKAIAATDQPSPERIRATIDQLPEPLRAPVTNITETLADYGRRGLDKVVFLHDLMKRAAKNGLTKALDFERTTMERGVYARSLQAKASQIAEMYVNVPEAERGNGPDSVNKFLYDSTIERKWGWGFKADPEMEARFNALSPESQAFAQAIIEHGASTLALKKQTVLDRTRSVFDTQIAQAKAAGDEAQVSSLQDSKAQTITKFQRLISLQEGWPYAPLRRTGEYVVTAKSPAYLKAQQNNDAALLRELETNPAEHQTTFVPNRLKAAALAAELRKTGNFPGEEGVQFFPREETRDMMFGGAAMLQALDKLRKNVEAGKVAGEDTSAELTRQVNDMYLQALTESSARKSEMRRRSVPGDVDMLQAFARQARADANFLAGVEYGPAEQEALLGLRQQAITGGNKERKMELYNEILKRYQKSLEFNTASGINKLTRMSSLWYLATSPRYFFINATQPWVLGVPELTRQFDYGAASSELWSAYKDLRGVIGSTKLFDQRIDFSKLPEDVRAAMLVLRDRGRLDFGMETELGSFQVDSPNPAAQTWNKIDKGLRLAVQKVETVNHLSTGMAAYRLMFAKTGNAQKAIDYADEVVYGTQGDYSKLNAPIPFNTNLGRVALQFRKMQLIQGSFYAKLINDAYVGNDRAGALRALAFNLGHTAVLAGMEGLPGYAALTWGLGQVMGKDDEPYNVTQKMRQTLGGGGVANLIMRGAPALAGADISGSVGVGNLFSILPFSTADLASRRGVTETMGSLLGGAAGSMVARMADGMGLMASGDYYRGLEATLPKGLSDAVKSYRIATEGVTRRNGDVLMTPEDVTEVESVLQALGFNPVRQTVRSQQQNLILDTNTRFQDKARKIKMDYIRAIKAGKSTAEARAAWDRLQESRVRSGYTRQPLSSLLKAPSEQLKRERRVSDGGVQYTNANREAVEELE